MADHTQPEWVSALIGAGATLGVGVLGWLGVRTTAKAPKADPQEVQNEGWGELLDQMRTELKAAAKQRDHLNKVLEEERRGWREEREAWRLERLGFLGQIHQLQAVAEGFERLLRRNGVELPERKTPAVEAGVVGVTLRQESRGDED